MMQRFIIYTALPALIPIIRAITNNTKKIKNRTLAIPIDAPETFVNPSIPAIIAMMKNITAHFNMLVSFNVIVYYFIKKFTPIFQ